MFYKQTDNGAPYIAGRLKRAAEKPGTGLTVLTPIDRAFRQTAEKDAAVMEIELKESKVADSSGLVLSAELKCPGPNGKVVSVWKESKEIGRSRNSGLCDRLQAARG